MYIFDKPEDCFGEADLSQLSSDLDTLLGLMTLLRPKLGVRAYILDEYVRQIIAVASTPTIFEAAEYASRDAKRMRFLLLDILSGQAFEDSHTDTIRAAMLNYPLPYQERTTCAAVYTILLADLIAAHTSNCYWRNLWRDWEAFDTPLLRALSDDLSNLLGEKDMNRLNGVLRQRFFIVTPVSAILQTLASDLAKAMTTLDPETKKYCLELAAEILDPPMCVEENN